MLSYVFTDILFVKINVNTVLQYFGSQVLIKIDGLSLTS